jgi:transketolase
MREAFSDALVRLGTRDPSLLLLTGDHGYALFDAFRKHCPRQYINAGIAEQNMVGMAAGLARMGFRPVVYGLSAFVPVRVIEQIKMDVCHDDLPVIFIGDGAGFVYSHLGTSHQSAEDVACTRAIPNITILSPADRFEMQACMDLAYGKARPVYLRMGKADLGDVHESVPLVTEGTLIRIHGEGTGVAVLATGSMVRTALEIGRAIPGASVWSVPTLKPIDVSRVVSICQSASAVVVLEEHSVHGGLASIVAEISMQHAPAHILPVGVADRFSDRCGTYAYLLREHGLDLDSVRQRVGDFLRG